VGTQRKAKGRESIWKSKEQAGEFLELAYIIGQSGCDALNDLADSSHHTWNYLKHLDSTINLKLLARNESQAFTTAPTTAHRDDEANSTKSKHGVAHSTDFRSVRWCGEVYSFTANQAQVIQLLLENWIAGTPDIGDETLLMAVDPEAPPARLHGLFRNHPAWGVMIVAGRTKGTRRLSNPAEEKS